MQWKAHGDLETKHLHIFRLVVCICDVVVTSNYGAGRTNSVRFVTIIASEADDQETNFVKCQEGTRIIPDILQQKSPLAVLVECFLAAIR